MSSSTMASGRPSASHARLARLKLDFSELLSSPYPGVSIHLDDSNMYKFCLHLCPDSGPYRGLCLHFDVELPHTVRFAFHRERLSVR
jgi:ubiquitin-protein ligase